MRRQIDGRRGSDEVSWSFSWFQYRAHEVVLLEWDAEPELGWPSLETDERSELVAAGHPRGVLASLLEMWKEEGTKRHPHYCHVALWALHDAARKGTTASAWRRLAMSLEGERGAESLRSLADRQPAEPEADADVVAPQDREEADDEEARDEPTQPSQAPSGATPSDVASAEPDASEEAAGRSEGNHHGGEDEASPS